MSQDVSHQWKSQAVETTESFDKLLDLDHWNSLANGSAFDNQSVVYTVDYTKIKIGDYVPNNQVYFNTADAEVSADGTHETVYRYFYYGMTDENDEGINTDHVIKQHYGGRQALEFTRTKTINTDGQWHMVNGLPSQQILSLNIFIRISISLKDTMESMIPMIQCIMAKYMVLIHMVLYTKYQLLMM